MDKWLGQPSMSKWVQKLKSWSECIPYQVEETNDGVPAEAWGG